MTHRGALIASFALTIAVALVLGTQWDLITTRGSQADPTATPPAPAEEFIDPNTSDSTDSTGGPGVAAQSGPLARCAQRHLPGSSADHACPRLDARGSWDEEGEHDDEDYEHDEHDD